MKSFKDNEYRRLNCLSEQIEIKNFSIANFALFLYSIGIIFDNSETIKKIDELLAISKNNGRVREEPSFYSTLLKTLNNVKGKELDYKKYLFEYDLLIKDQSFRSSIWSCLDRNFNDQNQNYVSSVKNLRKNIGKNKFLESSSSIEILEDIFTTENNQISSNDIEILESIVSNRTSSLRRDKADFKSFFSPIKVVIPKSDSYIDTSVSEEEIQVKIPSSDIIRDKAIEEVDLLELLKFIQSFSRNQVCLVMKMYSIILKEFDIKKPALKNAMQRAEKKGFIKILQMKMMKIKFLQEIK